MQINQAKENGSRAVANTITQKRSNKKQGSYFMDNRQKSNSQLNQSLVSLNTLEKGINRSAISNTVQRYVVDTRKGKSGYWDAKKIQTNNMGTKWWQFKTGPNTYIQNDFQGNKIGDNTYTGGTISSSKYGGNPVIATADVESSSGNMKMANESERPLSQVSDGAVFDAATRISGVAYKGTGNTWHHGKTLGMMYLLDTEIHKAFAPHVGWASQGGSRNEMRDFIVYDDY